MIGTKLLSRLCASLIGAVSISCAIIAASGSATVAASQVTSPCKPDAEQWVLAKLAAGVEADLGLCDEPDRVLRADFIVNLLTDSIEDVEVHYRGVWIANGVVAERLDLQLAEISHDTLLTDFRFEDDVDLSKSVFLKGISFARSRFGSANFISMKVGGVVVFDQAYFSGPVDFSGADMGPFSAKGSVFNDADRGTSFNSMVVRGHASFDDARFAGPVNFVSADISGQFQASRALFKATVNMNSMKVGAAALFNRAKFNGEVSLRVSDIQILNVTDVSWPGVQHPIQLDGMTYKIISAGDGSWKDLLNLADRAIYSRDVYTGLEEFYRSRGADEIADKFFVAQKRRQRKEVLGGPLKPAWWGSLLLDYLVLFGLSPHRTFVIGALFVLLGAGVYFDRDKYMQLRNPSTSAGRRERPPIQPGKRPKKGLVLEALWALGYSLDLFLPVVDLQLVTNWRPRGDVKFGTARLIYMRIQTLVGWILIPIGLLAVTGVFD